LKSYKLNHFSRKVKDKDSTLFRGKCIWNWR